MRLLICQGLHRRPAEALSALLLSFMKLAQVCGCPVNPGLIVAAASKRN